MARKKKTTPIQKIKVGYTRGWRSPGFRLLYLVIFAGAFMWLGHYLFPSHAETWVARDTSAAADLTRINNYRSNHGWSNLNETSCLDTIATNWAKKEAAQGAIQDPQVAWFNNQFKANCSAAFSIYMPWGANDGFGPYDSIIFTAFLNSCPHLLNIADHGTSKSTVIQPNGAPCTFTSAGFNRVGTGAGYSNGTLYISEFFARY